MMNAPRIGPPMADIAQIITGKVAEQRLVELVRENFKLTPKGIIESLNLRRPVFKKTAAYGHFGRIPVEMTVGDDTFTAFTWEKTDRAAALRSAAGL